MCAGINWSLLELNWTNTNMKHKDKYMETTHLGCFQRHKGTFKWGPITANVSWVELSV